MGRFKEYCGELFGQYNNNIKRITKDSTERIFELVKNNNNELHFAKKMNIGKFYLIKYNYNSLMIWCPIFIINDTYDTIQQKRIIHAINIDYLPYAYRILFFDIIFERSQSIIDHNKKDGLKVEKPIKLTFKIISKILKDLGGYDYAITGFNYENIYGVKNGGRPLSYFISTNFVNRFIFIDTKIVNLKYMKDMIINSNDNLIKIKLENLINDFESSKDIFNVNEQKEYYKRLRTLEGKYKKIISKK